MLKGYKNKGYGRVVISLCLFLIIIPAYGRHDSRLVFEFLIRGAMLEIIVNGKGRKE